MVKNPERFAKLQKSLQPAQALLLSTPADLAYFVQFPLLVPEEREGFLLITHDECYLIKAHFSLVPSEHTYQVLEHCRPSELAQHLQIILERHQIQELQIDASSLFVDEYQAIQTIAAKKSVTVSALDRQKIWQLRMIKADDEVELLKTAGQYGEKAWQMVSSQLQVGVTEKEVAQKIEIALLQLGAQRSAFPTIVAFGANSAFPHYQPADVALTANTSILIDMGAMFHGYRSDLTRSWWFGDQVDAEFAKISQSVQGGYEAAKNFLITTRQKSLTITAADVDKAARTFITEQGYGPQFMHTTGHGVGLDIHEPPSLNWSNTQELKTGMVITIEPGVYLPGKFGYRHENTFLIQEKNVAVLTK